MNKNENAQERFFCTKCKRSGSQSSDDKVKEIGISSKQKFDDK